MLDIIGTLLTRGRMPVSEEMWGCFWDRLHDGNLAPGEAAAVLASLSTSVPDDRTLCALLASLQARRAPANRLKVRQAVNIVGTGGGPSTFNISTASAFVAAAMGVRVIKTGSRAYSSRCGCIDLLQRLRMPLTGSHDETEAMLERFGIACAGYYVYPPELTLLAKSILPLPMKILGRFFNLIGPLLADVPVTAQLTGVSDAKLLPSLKRLAAQLPDRDLWLCANAIGADELISFTENVLFCNDASRDVRLTPDALDFGPGSLKDLSPAATTEGIVAHFEALLSGEGPRAAIETVCLNAAAAAMLAGVAATWTEAVRGAHAAIERGHAIRLVAAVRLGQPRRSFSLPEKVLVDA